MVVILMSVSVMFHLDDTYKHAIMFRYLSGHLLGESCSLS